MVESLDARRAAHKAQLAELQNRAAAELATLKNAEGATDLAAAQNRIQKLVMSRTPGDRELGTAISGLIVEQSKNAPQEEQTDVELPLAA